jgi:hypothetical protein
MNPILLNVCFGHMFIQISWLQINFSDKFCDLLCFKKLPKKQFLDLYVYLMYIF